MSLPPFPAEPYQGVHQEVLENELLAVIRHRDIELGQLQEVFDRTFAALGQAIAAGLFVPVGPALAVYHGDIEDRFDVELGFPASRVPTSPVTTPAGDLVASALPAGPVAITSHLGSYDGLAAAWEALVAASPAPAGDIAIEVYVTDPSTTETDQIRTDLVLPITRDA